MATLRRRRAQNVPGDVYVDATCIDCDTCRWMAPDVFRRVGGKSAVHRQPEGPEARHRALLALVACPTGSIGTATPAPDIAAARDAFPVPVAEEVHHCGYHAEGSFGAASYLIRRPAGNVLVDSPRFAGPLVRRLEAMGGVDLMFLTHRDDVADHARFAERFGCRRVIHAGDVTPDTRDVEIVLEDEEPATLAEDLLAIPTPGHTRGHAVLLYRDRFLFTGDHLAYSESRGHLVAFRDACWFSWPQQVRSMERLRGHRFEWVLPGHGRRHHAPAAEMRDSLERCIAWMKTR